MIPAIAACSELVAEVERLTAQRDARGDMVSALAREVSDLRCILREIRDLTSEETVRELAASRLIQ